MRLRVVLVALMAGCAGVVFGAVLTHRAGASGSWFKAA
jgi:hypothetical protein